MRSNWFLFLGVTVLTAAALPPASAEIVLYAGSGGRYEAVDTNNPGRYAMPTYAPESIAKAGGVMFNVFYDDVNLHNGRGFDDSTLGPARRDRVSELLTYFADTVFNHTGVCDIKFEVSEIDGAANGPTLANSSTFFSISPGFTNGVAFTHMTEGTDPAPTLPDIDVTVDFGWPWYQGTGATPFDQLDFKSVMLHEITHGFGIAALSGATGVGSLPSAPHTYTIWEDFLDTGNGTKLFGGAPPSFLGSPSYLVGSDNGIRFAGPNALAALGATPRVYAPGTFADGSSLSHWDTTLKALGEAVMQPFFSNGEMVRQYAPVDLGALQDLGYSIIAAGELFSGFLVSQNPMGWYEEGSPLALSVRLTGAVLPIMSYQWMLNGGDILDATLSTYGKDHVSDADEGAYTCAVTDSSPGKAMITVGPFVVSVFPAGSLPIAGIAGLGLAAACVIAGAIAVLRRTR
jgi:hypothetical protein